MAEGFDEWSVQLALAERAVVPGAILKLQRSLAFLTLGAAIPINGVPRKVSGVVLMTPVETGRARSSWNVSLGSPLGTYPPPGQQTYDQNNAMTQAGSLLASLGEYQTVWIASGLPYIKVLEYGGYPDPPQRGSYDRAARQWVIKSVGGYSRQAPRGMVRVTVEAVRAALGGAA